MTTLKKIVSINLIIVLILCSTISTFANDVPTGSSFEFNDSVFVEKLLDETKAGDSKAATTVTPQSSSAIEYYATTSGSGSSNSRTLSSWGDIVTYITSSLAKSIYNLYSGIHSDLSVISTQFGTFYSAWNTYKSSVTSALSTLTTTGVAMDLGSPWQPYFMPADDYNFNSTEWKYYWQRRLMNDGTLQTNDINETNWLVMDKHIKRDIAGNIAIVGKYLISASSRDSNLKLYSSEDLTYTTTPKGDNGAFWKDFRLWGSNISENLAKVTYIFSNQADLELKQAEEDNVEDFTDNFTTGNISMSGSDMGAVKGVTNNVKSSFGSNASVSDGTSVLNSNSEAWSWFTTHNPFIIVQVRRRSNCVGASCTCTIKSISILSSKP